MQQVQFTRAVINNEMISVMSAGTSWFNESFVQKIAPKELLEMYTKVIRLAKSQGVKVVYRYGTKRSIQQLAVSYEASYARYEMLYKQLVDKVKAKVDAGFNIPTSDDTELSAVYELKRELHSELNQTAFKEIREISRNLERFYNDLNATGCTLAKIYL